MPLEDLGNVEQRAFQVLLDDWEDLLRCTTVDQAMERAGVPFSHEARLRIAAHLRASQPPAMSWELPTYVLTNAEKRVARHLFARWQESEEVPPASALATLARTSTAQAAAALETLVWLGLLERRGQDWVPQPNSDSLAGLGLHYHEVVLPERGERFNTNCVPDFFIMTHPATRERRLSAFVSGDDPLASGDVGMTPRMTEAVGRMTEAVRSAVAEQLETGLRARSYDDQTAILNDTCAWSDIPIRIVMAYGGLSAITPESTWYLVGGG